jgi:hypothetical protein
VEQGKVEQGKVEQGIPNAKKWGEATGNLVHTAATPQQAAKFIAMKLREVS